jgi:predicted NBD/HSP70 family sugar kinase
MAGEVGHVPVFTHRQSWLRTDSDPRPGASQTPWIERRFSDLCHCGKDGHVDCYATPMRLTNEANAHDRRGRRRAFEDLTLLGAQTPSGGWTAEAKIFRQGGWALGIGLVSLINIANPSRLIIQVPEELSPDFARKGSVGHAFRDALETAVRTHSFSNGALGADGSSVLTYRLNAGATRTRGSASLLGEVVSADGVRAAAVRVMDDFVSHAMGLDICRRPIRRG